MFSNYQNASITHNENRIKICLFCLKKKKPMHKIEGTLQKNIEAIINYDKTDDRLPAAVCVACKIIVYRSLKLEKEEIKITLPDYSKFQSLRKNTRSENSKLCSCNLCELVRNPGSFNFVKKQSVSQEVKELKNNCKRCNLEISWGKPHFCTTKTSNTYQDLKEHFNSALSPKQKEHLVCDLIKNINAEKVENENKKSCKKSLSLSQEHGKPLTILLGSKEVNSNLKRKQISINEISKISSNYNLSTNTVKGIASSLRVATQDRKLFESNLKVKFRELNHSLDSFFSYDQFQITKSCKNEQTTTLQTFVYCNNVKGLIEHVINKRSLNEVQLDLKFGIDGGGGFLKVCVSIQCFEHELDSAQRNIKRQRYQEGLSAKKFKDSGVKKILLIGLVPQMQENYDNIVKLWSLLKINDLKGTIATDLKLANILTGIMSHASSFPCTWCIAPKNQLDSSGIYRTIGSCLKNNAAWEKIGGSKCNAKMYKSTVHPPIFTGQDETLILDIIPPPELHLLLGAVNTIYKSMLTECETDSLAWAKKCNVNREFVHGSPAFVGNACKKLLEKVDVLRSLSCINCVKYVQCFKDLQIVVDSFFSINLKSNNTKSIDDFRKSYCNLNIPITPKIHAIFFHVSDFCTKTGRGLGYFSEQSVESVHADFKSTWNKYKVSDSHPEFSIKLLRAVQEYNAKHV